MAGSPFATSPKVALQTGQQRRRRQHSGAAPTNLPAVSHPPHLTMLTTRHYTIQAVLIAGRSKS